MGGPASGIGVLPGAGAGRAGVPGGYPVRPYGTYYAGNNALAAQSAAVLASASRYPAYSSAMYAGYPGAWAPTNLTSNSLYANPGYGAVAGQLGMGQQPVPYDYGSNVVTQPDAVYVNGDNVGTPQEYANQASQIAAAGTAQPDQNSQWQPIGVFAMVAGDQTTSDDVFQLAVNAQGILRGNYHNMKDNSVLPLAGAIDPKTQRAAWTIDGDKAPIYEAGIANLTQDQATMLLHMDDGQQRQFSLIRLPDQNQGGAQAAPADGQP